MSLTFGAAAMARLPAPRATPGLGHLWRWTFAPVPLLREGAVAGPVFRLRLWRPAVVGFSPEWNRAVLRDLYTFRSHGSLSGFTPYLAGGVVHTDQPDHDPRRRELNPHFHSRAIAALAEPLRRVGRELAPQGEFEALRYAGGTVRRMLNQALFGGRIPDRLLERFLTPLHGRAFTPLLPRPVRFSRMDAAIRAVLADPPPGTLARAVAELPGAAEELRVALAAGYDTTAHTLAWALWQLASAPRWRRPELLPAVIDEVLRLYPAGWVGSRRVDHDTELAGVAVPAGTLVLYSPFLTHRDPRLWPDPDRFHPDRFTAGSGTARPAWGYLPFSAGSRTCLGAALARTMLRYALEPFCTGTLQRLGGDPTVTAGITLRPVGPLWLTRCGGDVPV